MTEYVNNIGKCIFGEITTIFLLVLLLTVIYQTVIVKQTLYCAISIGKVDTYGMSL